MRTLAHWLKCDVKFTVVKKLRNFVKKPEEAFDFDNAANDSIV